MSSKLQFLGFLCLSCVLFLFLAGCTPKKAYHLSDSAPPLPLSPTLDWGDPNGQHDRDFFNHPSVAVIEFDESGKLWPCGDDKTKPYCEVNRAIDYIHEAREKRGAKNVTVITYVHGWHHDASSESDNFRNFQTLVHCLNWGNPANDNSDEKGAYEPVICTGMRPSKDTLYIGVYIGWRGESVRRKLSFITYLSVLNRHAAAARVAANEGDDGFEKTVLRLSEAAKAGGDPARFILLGHSFGGLIVNRVATQIYEKRMSIRSQPKSDECDDGTSALFTPFADLVVVINPADSSLRAADLAARLRHAQISGNVSTTPCESRSLNRGLRHPLLLSMHTSSDSATDSLGSFGLKLGIWIDRKYMWKMSTDWKTRPYQDVYLDDPPSVGMLRRNTINHVDYLRNLCYFDQPNRQDEVCLGLADTIHDLKRDAYRELVKEGDPTPKNMHYAKDPYYHGAYELLTSVCTEEWEQSNSPWSTEHQFDADFENRGSCKSDPDKAEERRKLHAEFQQKLKDYLAFPIETSPVEDDLLLDIYRRVDSGPLRCGDVKFDIHGEVVKPKPCRDEDFKDRFVGEASWNDSSLWTLNTSYEILQSHSGFWNADAVSIFMGIPNQFPVASYDDAYRNLPAAVPQPTYPPQRPRPMTRGHLTLHWPTSGQQQQQQQQQ